MVSRPLAIALAAGWMSALAFAQAAAQALHPPLSVENRGDIFMARKMYRDAGNVGVKLDVCPSARHVNRSMTPWQKNQFTTALNQKTFLTVSDLSRRR